MTKYSLTFSDCIQCTHTHTHTHTNTHTYTHTHTHTHTQHTMRHTLTHTFNRLYDTHTHYLLTHAFIQMHILCANEHSHLYTHVKTVNKVIRCVYSYIYILQ